MPNALAKLDDLKASLDLNGSDLDDLLTRLLEAATGTAARLVGQATLMRTEAITEYPRAAARYEPLVRLERYPLESVSTVKLAGYAADVDDFADIDSLVEGEDFSVDSAIGLVELHHESWGVVPQSNLVIYTAGWIDPSDAAPPATAIQPPSQLQQGIIAEASRLYNTRRDAGIDRVDAGSKTKGHLPRQDEAHPELAAACAGLERLGV